MTWLTREIDVRVRVWWLLLPVALVMLLFLAILLFADPIPPTAWSYTPR